MAEHENTGGDLAVHGPEGLEAPRTEPRTLAAIGAEIREHAARMEYHKRGTLWEAVEIGRRLQEARDAAAHGEWADFLARETGYTPRTASNFMRVFDGYKDRQNELFQNEPEVNRKTFSDLSYMQALTLLALPDGEREQFVEQNDVENMTVRELKEAVRRAKEDAETAARERDEAQRELDAQRQDSEGTALRIAELEEKLDKAHADKVRADEAAKILNTGLERERANAANAEASRAEMERSLQTLQGVHKGTLAELEELRNRPVDVAVEKVVDEAAVEAARAEERKKMENELRAERFNAQEAQKARNEMSEELNTAKSEVNDLRATVGEMKKREKQVREEVQKQYDADMADLRKKLEEALAAQDTPKDAPKADEDMAMFKILFEQVQGQINALHGLVLKVEGRGDTRTAQGLRNALTALSESVARVAKGAAA